MTRFRTRAMVCVFSTCASVAATAFSIEMAAGRAADEAVTATSASSSSLEPLFAQVAGTGPADSTLDPRVIRRGTLSISEKRLASGAIQNAEAHLLNLFPGVEIVSIRRSVESHSSRDYSWYGNNHGDEFGRAILSVINGTFGALVMHRGLRYTVLPRGDGLYDVLEMNDGNVTESSDDTVTKGLAPPLPNIRSRTTRFGATPLDTGGLIRLVPWDLVPRNMALDLSIGPMPDDGSVVDVLVVYSHQGALYTDPLTHDDSHTSLPMNLITRTWSSVAAANLSLANSGGQTWFKLVPNHPLELPPSFVESGDTLTDLERMVANQTIADLRELFAADLVVLVSGRGIAKDRLCGQADRFADYSVVVSACMPGHTFAHELGHQFGLEHDWGAHIAEIEESGGVFDPPDWEVTSHDNHGYVQVVPGGNSVRTIMAIQKTCLTDGISCPPILRWSNPNDVTQNNLPLGIPAGEPYPANDIRRFNKNRVNIANLRLSACRLLSQC